LPARPQLFLSVCKLTEAEAEAELELLAAVDVALALEDATADVAAREEDEVTAAAVVLGTLALVEVGAADVEEVELAEVDLLVLDVDELADTELEVGCEVDDVDSDEEALELLERDVEELLVGAPAATTTEELEEVGSTADVEVEVATDDEDVLVGSVMSTQRPPRQFWTRRQMLPVRPQLRRSVERLSSVAAEVVADVAAVVIVLEAPADTLAEETLLVMSPLEDKEAELDAELEAELEVDVRSVVEVSVLEGKELELDVAAPAATHCPCLQT
jgi:hypothetical protein